MGKQLLTVEEVADRLRVHPQTVRQFLRERELKGIAFGGRTGWRVEQQDLDEFIARRKRETAESAGYGS